MAREIEELLRSGNPVPGQLDVGRLAVDIAREVSETHRRPFLATKKRRLLALTAAGVVLIPGAAVAATATGLFSAETGEYGKAGMTEIDTSQYIAMCARDSEAYVETLAPTDRALPSGVTWSGIGHYIATAPSSECPPAGPGMLEQITGIKQQYLSISECAWLGAYLDAHARQDAGEQARAASEIAAAADGLVALNVSEGDDRGTVIRDAALQGNGAVLEQHYESNCTGNELYERTIGVAQK